MKDIVKQQLAEAGVSGASFVDEPFDYMTSELSEKDI
jgi:phycobilisome core component